MQQHEFWVFRIACFTIRDLDSIDDDRSIRDRGFLELHLSSFLERVFSAAILMRIESR